MSLAALAPQFGHEMEDSAMQEDHPADSAIAVDMESPKHHALTPQGTSYAETTALTSFWSHSQSQGTAGQLVDVEFETAGAYEDATEVEMTAAGHYEEDNELEMAYESGQPEFHYEVEDAEVRDAELTYEEHSHEPHAASHFAPLEHEQLYDIAITPAPEPETFAAAPDTLPFAEAVVDTSYPEKESRSEPALVTEGIGLESIVQHVSDSTGETHPTESALVATVELAPVPVEETPYEPTAETSETHPRLHSPFDAKVPHELPEAKVIEHTTGTPEHKEGAITYEASPQELEAESRFLSAAPPVLVTTISETSKSFMVALFSEPDVAAIPSSSNAASEPPIVLLAEQHSLFGESVADLLAQLRAELLHAQPEIIPPSEFEYKEVQLVVRDLQLVLTEDNIYSREISLFDLESMHRSCGLSGYLHLDFSLQPRFIDRYRAIRQAIEVHGGVNNTETVAQQEAKEEEREDIENVTSPRHQPKSPVAKSDGGGHAEDVEGTQPSSKQDNETDDDPGEEDTEEPPLPLDDGEASSWSEEQDEEGPAATGGYQPEEGHATEEWDDTVEDDAPAPDSVPAADGEEGVYSEEYLHEDDYIPGDLLCVEDEVEYSAGTAEELPAEEYAVEAASDEINDVQTGDNEYGDGGEPEETAVTAKTSESEEPAAPSGDADDNAPELDDDNLAPAEETAEYDDENEWDDLGYNAEPDATNEETGLGEPASTNRAEIYPVVERETLKGNHKDHGIYGSPDTLASLPHRKRSFNEVEAEPEGDLTLSPGSKKARHL